MFKDTILWVSDAQQSSVAARLESAGYAVLAARVREAHAVLFVNRSIDVVVLNAGSSASDTLMLVRGLRAIRRDIPILLVTADRDTAAQASNIEGCFVIGEDFDQIVPQLHAAIVRPAV